MKIEDVTPPWSDGIIMICTKCARKLGNEELSEHMKKKLKGLVNDGSFHKQIRVVTSSCLDICPDDRMAIAYATTDSIRTVTVDKDVPPEDLLKDLVK